MGGQLSAALSPVLHCQRVDSGFAPLLVGRLAHISLGMQGNTGYKNIGNGNTGAENKGQGNTGYKNDGNGNTGSENIGAGNSGDKNIG